MLRPFLACLALTTPALAAETDVTFEVAGQTVVGTLETPPGGPAPVVLLLHGFTGSRHELGVEGTDEGVFSRTARQLAEAGYASLRIDFRGSGDSDGEWADTTFSGQIANAVAAIDWLADRADVDADRLVVLGWSQGGLVASHAAAARADAVDALMLWAPVVHPLHSFEGLLGAEAFDKAFAADPGTEIVAELPWGGTTTLKAGFYHEMATTSPVAAVAGFDGPMQVIVAANDALVKPQPASGQVLLDYHDGPEALEVFDTDHVWSAFQGPTVLDTLMIPATLGWLEEHL